MVPSGCMKKKVILLIVSVVCLLFFFLKLMDWRSGFSEGYEFVEENALSVLTKKEKKALQLLFERFLFFDQFAYTLFGTKPLSIASLPNTEEARLGWGAWKKIEQQLRSPKFTIREYSINRRKFILVANLEQIDRVCKENLDLFVSRLGAKVSTEIVKDCIMKDGEFFQRLFQDEACLGTLLGYGKLNSELFAKNQELPKGERLALEPFSSKPPIWFYFSSTMPVYFACDPSISETQELKIRYERERRRINKLARKESLFIRMIVLLSAPS